MEGPPGIGPLVDQLEGLGVKENGQEAAEEEKRDVAEAPGLLEGAVDVQAVTQQDTIYSSASSFEDLKLSKELLDGLYLEMKFEKPSKIQATTLPMILTPPFRHLIAQAHNGSGKTTCFVLAMLSRVDPGVTTPQALLACPTRELVVQNEAVLRKMATYTTIRCLTTLQPLEELRDHLGASGTIEHQVVIGTHGRLKSFISKRLLPLRRIALLVFDEADEMLKQGGFREESERLTSQIKRATGDRTQILLFSATFGETVRDYAATIAPGANQVLLKKEELSLDVIKQYRVDVPDEDAKFTLIDKIIFPNCDKMGQTIVFVRTRAKAQRLKQQLVGAGHNVTAISGEMEMADRDRVTQEFREGVTRILISTDVLSRGFDVQAVTLVVNYDMPVEKDGWTPAYETYLHRIGRSGRFGRKGAAFNLTHGMKEANIMEEIARYFKKDIPTVAINDEDEFVKVLTEAGLSSGDQF